MSDSVLARLCDSEYVREIQGLTVRSDAYYFSEKEEIDRLWPVTRKCQLL